MFFAIIATIVIVLFLIGAFLVGAFLFTTVSSAPEGYEDADGFHLGRKDEA